jgi:hypothetical protein
LVPVRRVAGRARTLDTVNTARDADLVATLHGRSLLTTHDWSTAELDALLAVAARFAELDRAGVRTALLPDELAYALSSTTRRAPGRRGPAPPRASACTP